MELADFSLDALVDPFLERINREYVAKQGWLARQILEPAVEALIAVKLDPLAEQAVQQAVAYIRKVVSDWLKGGAKGSLVTYAASVVDGAKLERLNAVGINPLVIFAALQAAFTLIEKLLPYFQRTVNATSEDGSADRFVVALYDDSALVVALGLAA